MSLLSYYANINGSKRVSGNIFLNPPTGLTQTDFNLNTNYSYQIFGTRAIVYYFIPYRDVTVKNFYIFCNSVNGTASQTSLVCEVRSVYRRIVSQLYNPTGQILYTSATASNYTDSSSLKWIQFSFASPVKMSKNNRFSFLIYNNSALPGTNYPSIRVNCFVYDRVTYSNMGSGYLTDSGFRSMSGFEYNAYCQPPHLVDLDGEFYGQPFTKLTNTGFASSNAYKRGIIVSDLARNFYWKGINSESNSLITKYQVFSEGSSPSSSASLEFNYVNSSYSSDLSFPDNTVVSGNGPYKVVQNVSSATNIFPAAVIEDFSSLQDAFTSLYDFVNLCPAVYEDGAGGWTTDYSLCPSIRLSVYSKLNGLVCGNTGEIELLEKMIKDSYSTNEDFILKFYKNNYVPKSTSVASDFTEADFTNYVSKTLTRSLWSNATTTLGQSQIVYSEQNWTCGSTGNTLYGYYVVGATSGTLLWAEKFSLPRLISNSETIKITPKIILESGK